MADIIDMQGNRIADDGALKILDTFASYKRHALAAGASAREADQRAWIGIVCEFGRPVVDAVIDQLSPKEPANV